MEKGLIFITFSVHFMGGADLLEYIPHRLKRPWLMTLIRITLLLGAICIALNAIIAFAIEKVLPTARWASNMVAIAYNGATVEIAWGSILYQAILVIVFSVVTTIIIQRDRDKSREKREYLEIVLQQLKSAYEESIEEKKTRKVKLAGEIITQTSIVATLDSFKYIRPPKGKSWKENYDYYMKYYK